MESDTILDKIRKKSAYVLDEDNFSESEDWIEKELFEICELFGKLDKLVTDTNGENLPDAWAIWDKDSGFRLN